MRYFILFLFLLLHTAYAQSNDFSVIIHKPFNSELTDIVQDYDRHISAVGFSTDYATHASRSYNDPYSYLESISKHTEHINIVKLDSNAHITLDKNFALNKLNKAVSVLKTPNGGYFIGGYSNNGQLIILQLDSDANVIFTKIFATKNYSKMTKLTPLKDGGVLAVGSSYTSREYGDNLFNNGLGLNDIYISRFTKDGRMLWSKKYGTQFDDTGVDAVEADDGSLLILSHTNKGKDKTITITRVTEDGDKIWTKEFHNKHLHSAHRIIKLRDGNFLVSLVQNNTIDKAQIRLVKIDLFKNTLIDTILNTTYASTLNDIKEYSNGSIGGVGFVKDTYNTDGLFIVVDASLKMLCQEHFGDDNYDTFNALSILNNSQAAVAGIHTDANSQEANMWILKLNDDCTIAQKTPQLHNATGSDNHISTQLPSHLYELLAKLFQDEIDAHKIKLHKDLSIELIASEHYFEQSHYKLTQAQKKFLKHFSSKLIPFLQLHKEYIEALEIDGHTSSEWKNANFTQRYLKNEQLSMRRAFSVLSYMFAKQDLKTQRFLTTLFKGSGLSFSKRVMHNNTEDKKHSRKVSFKIILKNSTQSPQK